MSISTIAVMKETIKTGRKSANIGQYDHFYKSVRAKQEHNKEYSHFGEGSLENTKHPTQQRNQKTKILRCYAVNDKA